MTSLPFLMQGVRETKGSIAYCLQKCVSGLDFHLVLCHSHVMEHIGAWLSSKISWPYLCCICLGCKRKGVFHSYLFSEFLSTKSMSSLELTRKGCMIMFVSACQSTFVKEFGVRLAFTVIYHLAAWRAAELHWFQRLQIFTGEADHWRWCYIYLSGKFLESKKNNIR